MTERFDEDVSGPLGPVGRLVAGRRAPGGGYEVVNDAEPGQTLYTPNNLTDTVDGEAAPPLWAPVSNRGGGCGFPLLEYMRKELGLDENGNPITHSED